MVYTDTKSFTVTVENRKCEKEELMPKIC